MRFITKTSYPKANVSQQWIIAMDTAGVNTYAAHEPTTSGGVGVVELRDSHDALLWSNDGSSFPVFSAG
jgi:hypothetical protein